MDEEFAVNLILVAMFFWIMYLFFRKTYRDIKNQRSKNDFDEWQKDKFSSIRLYDKSKSEWTMENSISTVSGSHSFIAYTTENKLYYIDGDKIFDEIEIKNILDIKVDVVVNTRNVKRLIALTSTYDAKSTSYAHLTIITKKRNYIVNYLSDVNEVNRLKSIVERDIKELNSTNN